MLDDMIANMESNEKLSPKVTELFLRGKKLIILLFVDQNLISKYLKYKNKYNTLFDDEIS